MKERENKMKFGICEREKKNSNPWMNEKKKLILSQRNYEKKLQTQIHSSETYHFQLYVLISSVCFNVLIGL